MAAEDGLKAQKLLAQGIALGIVAVRQVYVHKYPGRCPGLGASALSGRVDAKHSLLSGRIGCDL